MKINANSIRMGNIIEHDGRLWMVIKKPGHTMPGKGGAFIQVEMRDVKSGTKLNERFRSNENVEKIRLDEKEYQYLFMDGNHLTLMDKDTFEQTLVDSSLLGDKIDYLQDGMDVIVESYNEETITVSLPDNVTLEVAETEAVVKGQTAANSYKPAVLTNNVRVMVPPFINVGDKVVVRIEDSTYLERAKV